MIASDASSKRRLAAAKPFRLSGGGRNVGFGGLNMGGAGLNGPPNMGMMARGGFDNFGGSNSSGNQMSGNNYNSFC